MKKIFIFLLILIGVSASAAQPYKKIIFFGDSLSDNGNLYRLISGVLPVSPPYFKGRFTNGYTWAENLGNFYYGKYYADYEIYAYGGASVIFRLTSKFFSPSTLDLQVSSYLLNSLFKDKTQTLFVIWIGGNDYLFDETSDPELATKNVNKKIKESIVRLINYGAKHFLILNLPDLSLIPFARKHHLENRLHTLSLLHNLALDEVIQEVKNESPTVNISEFNIYNLFNDFLNNIDKYNMEYHTHITNLIAACWQHGFFSLITNNKKLLADIQQTLHQRMLEIKAQENPSLTEAKSLAISQYISNTPELAYTYSLGQSYQMGNEPCDKADQYLFWDFIHPSAITHQILAKIVLKQSLGERV